MPKKIKKNQQKTNKKVLVVSVVVIILIFIIAATTRYLNKQTTTTMLPIPTPVQEGMMTPLSAEKTSAIHLEQQGNNTVNVVVDSGKGAISGVQLQLSYDPQVLTNIRVQKGVFFVSPIELQKSIDTTNGILVYAIAISPTSAPQQGKGVIATISYTPNFGVASPTKLTFLPGTKVTAEGIDESVLQTPPPFLLNITQ
jgi:hypothetical protein